MSTEIPWDRGGVLPGATLSPTQQERLHKLIGRVLPPVVYAHTMSGRRVLVAPEPVRHKTEGGLWKPTSVREREQMEMGAGWVVAAGPLVGSDHCGHNAGSILCKSPEDLLMRHVIYQVHAGGNLKLSDDDTEFGGETAIVVMTDMDIWMVGPVSED